MEDCYLAKATERLFLPLLQTAHPEVIDYLLPWEGVFHNNVVVAIEKEFAGHAHKVIHGLWGQGQMSFSKAIVVVDKSVDLNDSDQILSAILTNLDLNTDLILAKGVLDVLDHSSPTPNFGAKIGLDLTERFSGEPARTEIPADAENVLLLSPDQIKDFLANLPESLNAICAMQPRDLPRKSGLKKPVRNHILLIGLNRDQTVAGSTYADRILNQKKLSSYNIVLLYDAGIDLKDTSLILWKLFNNVDPQRDLHFKSSRVVVDACRKTPADGHLREWPDELSFDEP